MSHTPGPWFIQHGTIRALNKDTGESCLVASTNAMPASNYPNRISDARLIVVAPEMLAMLREVVDDLENDLDVNMAVRARALIAKAGD